MGAYIKNFKMPPPGKYRACVIVDEFGARITVDVATSYADHDLRLYPIVPVPPHERLIEESKVLDIVSAWCPDDDGSVGKVGDLREMLDEIEAIPTIIPAEEG